MAAFDLIECRPSDSISSRGIWLGDNPLEFFSPTFMLQIGVSAFFTGTINYFLQRFGFSSYFSHLMAAILISSSFFKIFSYQSHYMMEIFRFMSNIFFPFLVGLRMDIRMVNGSGRRAVLIGISVGVVPFLITYLSAISICFDYYLPTDAKTPLILCSVAVVGVQTSFHDVACVLSDLKIINSEVGRLAIASSIISNACSFAVLIMLSALYQSTAVGGSKRKGVGLYYLGSMLGFIAFITYVSKFIMQWMMKQVPPGSNTMKEVHVCMVFLMVLVCSFFGQYLGHSPGLAPLLMGLMIPPGPPLAETIEDKLESVVSYIFLPFFYVSSSGIAVGGVTDRRRVMFIVLLLVLGFVLKIIGTILPAMRSGLSFNDSFVLGLIISSPGIMDLVILRNSLRANKINEEAYNVLIYFSVVIAGLTSILVKLMYRPSTDNFTYKRRTLGDKRRNSEFRVLACIYRDFNVPSITRLIEASSVTADSPTCIYLLHLIKLQRIAPPLIISHKSSDKFSIYYNRSEHIINAFQYFQQQYKKMISLKSFSALSPCSTMHQDICSLAVDKRVDLVILPFHKQFNVDGIMEAETTIQNVNVSVLQVLPCPVGILIDRRRVNDNCSIAQSKSFVQIAIIFFGGVDDREVLTLGMRIVENPSITLTVIRYRIMGDLNGPLQKDKKLDEALLKDFRKKYVDMEGVVYKEKLVPNSLGTVKAMKEMKDGFDLIMVGRQHPTELECLKGLSEWKEHPELGIIGDMLATSKLHEDIPILVLQQRYTVSDV